MIDRILVTSCVLFACLTVQAQTLTTNDAGERIIVYPDGTWRYFNEPPAESSPAPVAVEDEVYTAPALNAEAEARARTVVRRRAASLGKELGKDEKELRRLRERESKAIQELDELRRSGDAVNRTELDIASRRLRQVRDDVASAEEALEAKRLQVAALEQSLPMTRSERKAFLAERRVAGLPGATADVIGSPDSPPSQPSSGMDFEPRDRTTARVSDKATELREYDQANDPRFHPPVAPCEVAYEGVDEFTQRTQRRLAPELLFAHTRPELKQYLGSEALVTARGHLARSGSAVALVIDFTIRSQFANREFGALPKGSQLTLKFVDGTTASLRNLALAQGVFDPVEKVYNYTARYSLSKSQQKDLERKLLDQARVMWGTGFEDYPIYEVDFFQRQLKCL